jgi:hypothetical protein
MVLNKFLLYFLFINRTKILHNIENNLRKWRTLGKNNMICITEKYYNIFLP